MIAETGAAEKAPRVEIRDRGMTTNTPHFIEPDDVDGGYALLPVFVTRTTLLAMLAGDTTFSPTSLALTNRL